MALTIPQLATAIRLATASDALSDDETGILTRLLSVANQQVTRYAADAPEDIRDEAAVRVVAYLYYSSPAGGRQLYANALASSGAAALLDPYRSAAIIIFGQDYGTPGAATSGGTGGGGTPADAAAIAAAIALHNAASLAHRDLSFPAPTLAQIKDALEAARGNARLQASAIRNLAAEIDAELGNNRWRDPNQPGQAGLTTSQVDDRIEAHTGQTSPTGEFAADRVPALAYVRRLASLPTDFAVGEIIAVDGQFYICRQFSSRTVKYTIASSGDDTGYAAAQGSDPAIGGIAPPDGEWDKQFLWDSDAQAIVGRVVSLTDPGATLPQVHGDLGTYTLRKTVGQGASTRRNSFVDDDTKYQYEVAVFTNPFTTGGVSGEQDFTVTPASPITYWEPINTEGLSAAEVDARIRALRPVDYTAAEKAKLGAYPDTGDTGNARKVLKFDNSGNPVAETDDGQTQTQVDARVQAAKGTARPSAITPSSGAAGSGTTWSPVDHRHPYTAPSGGGGMATPLSSATPEPVGTAAAGDDAAAARGDHAHPYGGQVPADVLPESLQTYARAYQAGGPRPYPNSTIQVGGTIKNTPFSVADFNAISVWGNRVSHASATAVSPNAYSGLRFAKSEYAARPTAMPTGVVMRVSAYLPEITPVITALPAADTATHWAFSATWGPQPADDQTTVLEIVEPATSNILPPDGSLPPSKLAGSPGPGVLEVVNDQLFRSTPAQGYQLVFSGSTGASPPSLSGNSALVTFAFDVGIDLDTVGAGELISDEYLRIITGPAALSWSPTAVVKTINVRGALSFQQIGFGSVYDGNANLGTTIVSAPLYIGSTMVGAFVRRISKNATNELAGNARYDRSTGHSNVQAAAISDSVRIFKLSTGDALLPSGAVGHLNVFDDVVPAADGYANNDVGIGKEGDARAVWVKDSDVTSGAADTGWAGQVHRPRPVRQPPAGGCPGVGRQHLSSLSVGRQRIHRPAAGRRRSPPAG